MAAEVARGARLEWWGLDRLERVASYHRYLEGQRWDYAFPILAVPLLFLWAATGELLGVAGLAIAPIVLGAWFGRTRYERISVDEHGGITKAGAGLVGVAAGATLWAGLAGTISGGAHFQGVVQVATERGYAYNFRLASLLLLGIMLVFGGVLCLTAVRGLARARRRAWERGLTGALLLVVVATPMMPLGAQGELAGAMVLFAAVSLITLVLAFRQLEPAHDA